MFITLSMNSDNSGKWITFILITIVLSFGCIKGPGKVDNYNNAIVDKNNDDNYMAFEGVVFLDSNENLIHDIGEPGVPDVFITDGENIVKSDLSGRFSIKSSNSTEFIYITKPSGYKLTTPFYINVQNKPLNQQTNFGITKKKESESFSFIFIGDPPYPTSEDLINLFSRDVEEINNLISPPSFVVVGGDLVAIDGKKYSKSSKQFKEFKRIIDKLDYTVYTVLGNHDIYYRNHNPKVKGFGKSVYKEFLGPTYYSFVLGEIKFIIIDIYDDSLITNKTYGYGINRRQLTWLKNDLSQHQGPYILFSHAPPYPQYRYWKQISKLFNNTQLLAIFSGHSHSLEKGKTDGSINYFVGSATIGAKWPISVDSGWRRRGYLIANLENDTIRPIFATFGKNFSLDILSPRFGSSLLNTEKIKIIADVYTINPIEKIEAKIDEEEWQTLNETDQLQFGADVIHNFSLGEHEVSIRVKLMNGETYSKKSIFRFTSSATNTVLYSNRFDIGPEENYIPIEGNWRKVNGSIEGIGENWTISIPLNPPPPTRHLGLQVNLRQVEERDFINYSVEGDINIKNGSGGFLFYWKHVRNGFYSFLLTEDDYVVLLKHGRWSLDKKRIKILCAKKIENSRDTKWQHVKIELVGNTIVGYVNYERVLMFIDRKEELNLSGRFGLIGIRSEDGNVSIVLDNIIAKKLNKTTEYINSLENTLDDSDFVCNTGNISVNMDEIGLYMP